MRPDSSKDCPAKAFLRRGKPPPGYRCMFPSPQAEARLPLRLRFLFRVVSGSKARQRPRRIARSTKHSRNIDDDPQPKCRCAGRPSGQTQARVGAPRRSKPRQQRRRVFHGSATAKESLPAQGAQSKAATRAVQESRIAIWDRSTSSGRGRRISPGTTKRP